MKKTRFIFPAVLALVLAGGCHTSENFPDVEAVANVDEESMVFSSELSQKETRQGLFQAMLSDVLEYAPERRGSGRLIQMKSEDEDEEEKPLTPEQKSLITGYMDAYFESMADLKLRNPSMLFAEPEGVQAAGNRAVWEYLIELRKMQSSDLTLAHYKYELFCRQGGWGRQEEEIEEDGKLRVIAIEQSIQNFTEFPETDAESAAVYHQFTLVETSDGWRIESHMQMDTLYIVLFLEGDSHNMREYLQSSFPEDKGKEYIAQRLETLLRDAKQEISARREHFEPVEDGKDEMTEPDHPYDREAAVAYAMEWVGKRNEEWEDYGRYGGNCQNYVSQCLFAGGIPMDPYGDSLWKWYSDIPNNYPGTYGRSASWSAVESFRDYAENNTGFGLAAQAGAPYYSGEIGDVLEIGTADNPLRHSVLITKVIKDQDGNTIDYLICSNTSDLKNFPASAYFYSSQALVKILGWND